MENKMKNKQKIALDKTAELCNSFIDIEENEMHPDDTNDVKFHIHAIQNILFTQLYKKQNEE